MVTGVSQGLAWTVSGVVASMAQGEVRCFRQYPHSTRHWLQRQKKRHKSRQPSRNVNRILVDDICGAILAAVEGDRPLCGGRAYNLVDDDPAPRKEVVVEARRLLSPATSFDDSQSQSSVSTSKAATKNTRRRISRATGKKRCDNSRLKADYGWKLKGPTYREGLALLLENSDLKL